MVTQRLALLTVVVAVTANALRLGLLTDGTHPARPALSHLIADCGNWAEMLLVLPALAVLPLLPVALPFAWIASHRYANARLRASVLGQARTATGGGIGPGADVRDVSGEPTKAVGDGDADSFESVESWEADDMGTGASLPLPSPSHPPGTSPCVL